MKNEKSNTDENTQWPNGPPDQNHQWKDVDSNFESQKPGSEAKNIAEGQLTAKTRKDGPIHTDKSTQQVLDQRADWWTEDPLIGVIPLENGSLPMFVQHESPDESKHYVGKSTIHGQQHDFPKIQVLNEVKTTTKSKKKSLQDSQPEFTPPAKFTAKADEIILESAEDLVSFSSKYGGASQDGTLPVSKDSPLMFDIIYMGSRPLKMVLNHDKLILIDPQYIKNEEYLTHPPSQVKSNSLEQVLPSSVLDLFKTEDFDDGSITTWRSGPRDVSLPRGDQDSSAGSNPQQEDKDTGWYNDDASNLQDDPREFVEQNGQFNPSSDSLIAQNNVISQVASEYPGSHEVNRFSQSDVSQMLIQESYSHRHSHQGSPIFSSNQRNSLENQALNNMFYSKHEFSSELADQQTFINLSGTSGDKTLLSDAYGLYRFIKDRPSVVLIVTCVALLIFGVGYIFGGLLSTCRKPGLKDKLDGVKGGGGSGARESEANSSSQSFDGSQSDRANHGSPEAIHDAEPKRNVVKDGGGGNGLSLKAIKLPNSDELISRQEGSHLGTDRSPKDSQRSKNSWKFLNNDIQQSRGGARDGIGQFKTQRSPPLSKSSSFVMQQQLGDTSGQNTSETVKVQRDRIYSEQVFNSNTIYEVVQSNKKASSNHKQELEETAGVASRQTSPEIAFEQLLMADRQQEQLLAQEQVQVPPFAEMVKHNSMIDPRSQRTSSLLFDAKGKLDSSLPTSFKKFPSLMTKLGPLPDARIQESNPEISVLEQQTYQYPSMVGAIKQKNKLVGHSSFDYEVKTASDPNFVADGNIGIEVINSPEIMPKKSNEMTEQDWDRLGGIPNGAGLGIGGEMSCQQSLADSESMNNMDFKQSQGSAQSNKRRNSFKKIRTDSQIIDPSQYQLAPWPPTPIYTHFDGDSVDSNVNRAGRDLVRTLSIKKSSNDQGGLERKVLGEVLAKSEINSVQVREENVDLEITFKATVKKDKVMSILSRGNVNEFGDRSTPEHDQEDQQRPSYLQITYGNNTKLEQPFEMAERQSQEGSNESEEDPRAKNYHLEVQEHTASERSRSAQSKHSKASRKSKGFLKLPNQVPDDSNKITLARAQINRASRSEEDESKSSSLSELFFAKSKADNDDSMFGKAFTPNHNKETDEIIDNKNEGKKNQKQQKCKMVQLDGISEISEESPLQNFLDTGRLQKKFKDIEDIGQGGFGKVKKAVYLIDQKTYAIKVVRLHIPKNRCKRSSQFQNNCESENPLDLIYHHRVYRELKFFTQNISSEHIVRYFNSWFEELDQEERKQEAEYRAMYCDLLKRKREKRRQKLELKAKRTRAHRMIVNRAPSPTSWGSSIELQNNSKRSKRQKWKSKMIGSSQDSSDINMGSSIRSKNKSIQRLSFGLQNSSKGHGKGKSTTSPSGLRLNQSFIYPGGKSSAHEFTITEKINEENNEETENEDFKNDNDYFGKKYRIRQRRNTEQKKPTLDHVQTTTGDDQLELDQNEAIIPQHRDSVEDTKQTNQSSRDVQAKGIHGQSYLKGPIHGSKRSRSPVTHSSKSDLSGVVIKKSSRPKSVRRAVKKKKNGNSRRSVTASLTSSEESESSAESESDQSSAESSSESESKQSGLLFKGKVPSLSKKESIYKESSNKNDQSIDEREEEEDFNEDDDLSSDEEEFEETSGYDVGGFSQATMNNFLKEDQEFHSVNIMIQMEYCSGQSLEKFLQTRNDQGTCGFVSPKNDGVIDRRQNLSIFTQVIKGMEEIHKHDILHRDLKPENIFIDGAGDNLSAKIGDFGLARLLKPKTTSASDSFIEKTPDRRIESCNSPTVKKLRNLGTKRINSYFSTTAGTEVYMAPEIKQHYHAGTLPQKFNNVEINKAQDIYQLGLILYELCHKMPTMHQRNVLFKKLLKERQLSKDCPLRKGEHIEYDMILAMTEELAQSRPSIPVIISTWLSKWEQQIAEEDKQKQLISEEQSLSKETTASSDAAAILRSATKESKELKSKEESGGCESLHLPTHVGEREGKTRRAKANLHVEQE